MRPSGWEEKRFAAPHQVLFCQVVFWPQPALAVLPTFKSHRSRVQFPIFWSVEENTGEGRVGEEGAGRPETRSPRVCTGSCQYCIHMPQVPFHFFPHLSLIAAVFCQPAALLLLEGSLPLPEPAQLMLLEDLPENSRACSNDFGIHWPIKNLALSPCVS